LLLFFMYLSIFENGFRRQQTKRFNNIISSRVIIMFNDEVNRARAKLQNLIGYDFIACIFCEALN